MREIRSSGSVEGVMSNHDPYSDRKRRSDSILASGQRRGILSLHPKSETHGSGKNSGHSSGHNGA